MQVVLQGSLRHFGVAELLWFLCNRGQDGTLDVESSGKRGRVIFRGETIVWAEAQGERDPLDAAIAALGFDAGTFTLLDSAVVPDGVSPMALSLSALFEERAQRKELSAIYSDDAVFRVVGDPALEQVSLTADEFKLLFRLGEGRTLKDLASEAGTSRKQLVPRLQHLEEIGLVQVTREQMPWSESETPARPAPAPSAEAVDPDATRIQPEARASAPSRDLRTVAERLPVPPPAEVPPPAPPRESAPAPTPEPAGSDVKTQLNLEISRTRTMIGSLTPEASPENVIPLLEDEQTIGRVAGNTVTIPDGSISSNHARILRTADGFIIEDLKSRNGTFVNGEKVTGTRPLADGDLIRLGKVLMTFNIAREEKAGEATRVGLPDV